MQSGRLTDIARIDDCDVGPDAISEPGDGTGGIDFHVSVEILLLGELSLSAQPT